MYSCFLRSPRSASVTAHSGVPPPRSQDMRIKYMFIAQRYVYDCKRYGLRCQVEFCTANVVSDTHRRVLLIGVCLSGIRYTPSRNSASAGFLLARSIGLNAGPRKPGPGHLHTPSYAVSLSKGGGSWRCGGGQRSGRGRVPADQIVEDAAPDVTALLMS